MTKKQLEQLLSDLLEKDHEIKRQQKYIDHLADQLMDSNIDNMDLLSRVNDLEQECNVLTEDRNNKQEMLNHYLPDMQASAKEHAAAIRIKNYIEHGACGNLCIDCVYIKAGDCIKSMNNDTLVLADAIIRWWDNA